MKLQLTVCIAATAFMIVTHAEQVTTKSKHSFHHPQEFKQALKNAQHPGEKIYQKLCANCHALKPLIPLGAPRIGVVDDWKPRMTRNVQAMFEKIDVGFNAMPARGGCFECSDQELKEAIAYMLPKNDKK